MNLRVVLTFAGALLLGGSLIAVAPPASAGPTASVVARFGKKKSKKAHKKRKKKGKKGKTAGDGPAQLSKKIRLAPKGLRWGMTLNELSQLYSKVLDKQFVPLYKRVQPGPRMQALDAELADKKGLIKRNHLTFGDTPTGIDYTPLKGEYTYKNKESMTHLRLRSGIKRHFFFFDKRLWKIYDEHRLRKKSKLGKSFKDAIKRLTKKLKVAPRLREATPEEGLSFTTADWQDGTNILRVVDRGEGLIAVVYVDQSVFENIDRYRTAKVEDPTAIDKDVQNVTDKSKSGDDKNKDIVKKRRRR